MIDFSKVYEDVQFSDCKFGEGEVVKDKVIAILTQHKDDKKGYIIINKEGIITDIDSADAVLTVFYGISVDGDGRYKFKNGSLYLPDVLFIPERKFEESVFRGSFIAPKVTVIGEWALADAHFTGLFLAPNVEIIGGSALYKSPFIGPFIAPLVKNIGSSAFSDANFVGSFIASNIEVIGYKAF